MKRMLDDEQIFELQELLEQVSIAPNGVVNINKVHSEELTISDNGKWNGEGIEATNINLTSVFENNAGKVLAVNEDEDGLVVVENLVASGSVLNIVITEDDYDAEEELYVREVDFPYFSSCFLVLASAPLTHASADIKIKSPKILALANAIGDLSEFSGIDYDPSERHFTFGQQKLGQMHFYIGGLIIGDVLTDV